MFCKYCGSPVSETAKFCQKCGAKMKPKSSADVQPEVVQKPQEFVTQQPYVQVSQEPVTQQSYVQEPQEPVIQQSYVKEPQEPVIEPSYVEAPQAPAPTPAKPQTTAAEGTKKKGHPVLIIIICVIVVILLGAAAWIFLLGGSDVLAEKGISLPFVKTEEQSGYERDKEEDEEEDDDQERDFDEEASDVDKESEESSTEAAVTEAYVETKATKEVIVESETEAVVETEAVTKEISVYAGSLDEYEESKEAVAEETTKVAETKPVETKPVETKAPVKNGWLKEGGNWYYYQAGNKVTGWLQDGGKWYFLESNGKMFTGGWKTISGYSYYFGSDGAMYVNTVTPDGYTVDGNGHIVENTSSSGKTMAKKFTFEGTYYDEDNEEEVDAKVVLSLKKTGDYSITIKAGTQKVQESGKYVYHEDEEYIEFSGQHISEGYCDGYSIDTWVSLLGDVVLES